MHRSNAEERPDFLREIIEIDAMCYEPVLDTEALNQRISTLIKNHHADLKYVRETEDFLDMYAECKY